MEQHKHPHIYREQASQLLKGFGAKPTREVRAQIQKDLEAQKERFLALERLRSQERGKGSKLTP